MISISKTQLGKKEIDAVVKVLKSGNIREGVVCHNFEEAFAKKVGARYATTMANGTVALHASFLNLIKPGDEVIVPSMTFFATASMICWAGGKPVFCDIDPRTFCIDIRDLKQKITYKTKAIVPVHLFGNSCDIDPIIKLSRKHGLKVVWDAAQAHFTRYKGNDVGSYGDAVCYSFYATKNMTTGEGGMVTSNNRNFIKKCILLKHQGQAKKYYHTMLGINYRMTDVEAAIGLVQLNRLEEFTDRRRKNAYKLIQRLKGIPFIITPYMPDYAHHAFHQFTILLKSYPKKMTRERIISTLKANGIQVGMHYPIPLHKQPIFKKIVGKLSLVNSEFVARRCISLPVHPSLKNYEIDLIVQEIKNTLL